MTITLRIVLFSASFLTPIFIMRKIRKAQVEINDAIFWILSSIGLLVIGVFPQIAIAGAAFLEIQSPVNFVFLAVLFIVIVKLFLLSIEVSIQKTKLKNFVEEYALREAMKTKSASKR